MSEQPTLHPGDIVQITDQKNRWFPSLIVVEEVRAWGVQGFAFMPSPKGPPSGKAYYRLKTGEFEKVGALVMIPEDIAKAREASLETAAQLAAEQGRSG
jgi:hypothetical protein